MEKLNTLKFRRHPGGLRGIISTIRILLPLSIAGWAIISIASVVSMFSDELQVEVRSPSGFSGAALQSDSGSFTGAGSISLYSFGARNVFDWLFFDRSSAFPNVFICIPALLIAWYTYKIFKSLTLDRPFSLHIARYIKCLGFMVIVSGVYSLLRKVYMDIAIYSLTGSRVVSGNNSIVLLLSLGLIILIIAEVYRKGCELQEDKDLTV